MPARSDTLIIEILPNGDIKAESPDRISGPNHGSAEAVFRAISEQGPTTRTRKAHAHQHQHQHAHEHDHAGH